MTKQEMIIIDTGIEIAKSDLIDTFSDKELLEPYLNLVREAVYVPDSKISLATDKGLRGNLGSPISAKLINTVSIVEP